MRRVGGAGQGGKRIGALGYRRKRRRQRRQRRQRWQMIRQPGPNFFFIRRKLFPMAHFFKEFAPLLVGQSGHLRQRAKRGLPLFLRQEFQAGDGFFESLALGGGKGIEDRLFFTSRKLKKTLEMRVSLLAAVRRQYIELKDRLLQ